MKRSVRWPLTIGLLLLFVGGGASWYFSSVIIRFKTRTIIEDQVHRLVWSPAQFGLPAPEDYEVRRGDLTLRGWFFPGKPGRCGVILHHGHKGTRIGGLKYAPLFLKRGCHFLLPDARYHGESSGSFGSYGYLEQGDMQALLDYFVQRTGLPRSKIGLMGESMGGAIVLLTAAREPELAFVAADSAYSDLPTILREGAIRLYAKPILVLFYPALQLAEWRSGLPLGELSIEDAARQIGMPLFVSHSLQDIETLPEHSQRIFDASPSVKKVLHFSDFGARHGKSIDTDFSWYQKHMDDFLDRYVPGFGGRTR
ncbi:MAG: alpha/beta hydrolase [Spirochaetales bacterium]|nr:alpha/beta hydrolase [Spirochaetales bacterium]